MTDIFAEPRVVVSERAAGGWLVRSAIALPEYAPRITDHLFAWAERQPHAPFLCSRTPDGAAWRTLTWGDAAAQVRALAAGLLGRGLGPDRGVVVLSGNGIEHALLGFAAMSVGVPWAPISPPYSLLSRDLEKLRHVLRLLRPGLIFVDAAAPYARALAVEEAAEAEVFATNPTGVARARPFGQIAATPDAGTARAMEAVRPDAVVKLLFTSGSTGLPKGVLTTHAMLAANQEQIATVWPFLHREPPVLLDWLPWNHVFGGSHNLNMVLRHGGTLWIDDGRPMPDAIGRTVENLRHVSPTISFNVPKGYELLLPHLEADAALRETFLARMRIVFYAAASLPPTLWARLESVVAQAPHRVHMACSWGLTETAPAAVLSHVADAPSGCIGTPLPGVELLLLPDGDKLEVRIRGPLVTQGYLGDPAATAAAFDDAGFFRTGDAMRWQDPDDPTRGLRFDGRLTEDFKLITGTRVNVGALKPRALMALAAVARDLVVVGADRGDIGLLLIPHHHRLHEIGSAALGAEVADALRRINADGDGASSLTVARACFLREPLSLDAGEITDKGSLNVRAILTRRAGLLAQLYDAPGPEVILP